LIFIDFERLDGTIITIVLQQIIAYEDSIIWTTGRATPFNVKDTREEIQKRIVNSIPRQPGQPVILGR
jgi:hypothetical protein